MMHAEVDRTRNTHGLYEKDIHNLVENLNVRGYLGDLGVDGKIILN